MSADTVQSMRKANTPECRCHRCQSGCETTPGLFIPGEVATAAKHLGLTPKLFFQTFLVAERPGIDAIPEGGDPFALAPATASDEPGREGGPKSGRCIFWNPDGGDCRIHEAKPFECREAGHYDSNDFIRRRGLAIMEAWESAEARAEIRGLLGREPSRETR